MNSSSVNNLLPTVTAVVEDIFTEYETKWENLWDDIRTFNELLRPIVRKSEVSGVCIPKVDKSIESSIEKLDLNRQSKLDGCLALKDTVSVQEQIPEKPSLARQLHEKGFPKELNNALKSIDNYLQNRRKPGRETEKKKFLYDLECSWAEEYNTYQIFEPDLTESLKRYLAVLEEKSPPPEIPVWPTTRMKDVSTLIKDEEKAIQNAQERINIALSKDLSKIDLGELQGNQKLLVALHRLITALSDITQLKSDIIVHGNYGDSSKGSTGDLKKEKS